jgi:hypothetical protein
MKPPLFHVGQAVVCVEEWEPDDAGAETYRGPLPERGPIYIISRVVLETGTGMYFVQLKDFDQEPFFHEEGFAPAEEMPAEAYAELLEAFEPVTA